MIMSAVVWIFGTEEVQQLQRLIIVIDPCKTAKLKVSCFLGFGNGLPVSAIDFHHNPKLFKCTLQVFRNTVVGSSGIVQIFYLRKSHSAGISCFLHEFFCLFQILFILINMEGALILF